VHHTSEVAHADAIAPAGGPRRSRGDQCGGGAGARAGAAPAGNVVTVTFPLPPAIISSGHVTIWAQDDHSVESITVNLTGCCLTPNVGTCDSTNPAFIGQSSFDRSCSDPEMSYLADCGRVEGNNWGGIPACLPGNSNASCINQWILAGITGLTSLDCSVPSPTYVCTTPITALSMIRSPIPPSPNCVRITGRAGVTSFDVANVCAGDTVTVPGYDCQSP
jgi:hypothetical protein